jgi:hypothetical protein
MSIQIRFVYNRQHNARMMLLTHHYNITIDGSIRQWYTLHVCMTRTKSDTVYITEWHMQMDRIGDEPFLEINLVSN